MKCRNLPPAPQAVMEELLTQAENALALIVSAMGTAAVKGSLARYSVP